MILVHGQAHIGPEIRQQWLDLTEPGLATSRAAAGNQMYVYAAELFDPTSFHVFQLWDDQPSIDAHIKDPHHQERLRALDALGGRWSSVTHYDISDVRRKR